MSSQQPINYLALKLQTVKQLKELCRNDRPKYYGFSYHTRKEDIIKFIISTNSSNPIRVNTAEVIPNLYSLFETPEEQSENIERMMMERPEEQFIEEQIQEIQRKYPKSNVIYDINNDPQNDLIYKANKTKYITQHGSLGEYDEQILFHGTDENNLISILRDDFRLTSNPVHGSLYGRGIYFTNDIDKAIYYSERTKKTKFIIVAIVHIGDIVLGESTMNYHPMMPGGNKIYDTSVDNIQRPKQFIKKKNGTYNILGVIRIDNFTNTTSNNSQFSSGFTIRNTSSEKITLYWIYPKHASLIGQGMFTFTLLDPADKRIMSRMSTILPHNEKGQLCQIGHIFAISNKHGIIRIFESKKKGELVKI